MRAYGLAENVLDDIARVRTTGVTFAPEAGTQRMRDVVNKNVTEEQLLETAERVFSRGWKAMKLYFMIGLPTEEEADVREIPRVGGRARAVGKRVKQGQAGGPPTVTVSVSTHVPKPHTPFQWCAMDDPASVRRKQRWLEEEARTAKVDLRAHDCDTSWLEGVFARGDRSLGPVLERAYRAGARFDSWEDQKRMDLWEAAFAAEGVDPATFLGTIPVSARLPWDHVDVGLEDGFLLREYRKALKSRLSLPCGKVEGAFVHATNVADAVADSRKLVCYDCGIACDLSAMREQRLVFLRKLGAETPPVPAAKPAPPPVAPSATARPAPRPRPSSTFGEPRRHRFVYEKLGAAAYLSHLDVIRALPRVFRRLAIPLHYSQGFHPKPEMVFGPALSLGVASLCEVVDVKIDADVVDQGLLEALSASSQPGLRFVGGARLDAKGPSVAKVLDAARYVVAVPRTFLQGVGGEAWVRGRLAVARAAETDLTVTRRIDGVGKKVDVRRFLRSIDIGGARAHAELARAGTAGAFVALEVDVDVTNAGGVKISEVVEAVFRGDDLPHASVRTALGARSPAGDIVSPLLAVAPSSAPLGEGREGLAPRGGGASAEQA